LAADGFRCHGADVQFRPAIHTSAGLNGRSTLADAAKAPEKDHRAQRPSKPPFLPVAAIQTLESALTTHSAQCPADPAEHEAGNEKLASIVVVAEQTHGSRVKPGDDGGIEATSGRRDRTKTLTARTRRKTWRACSRGPGRGPRAVWFGGTDALIKLATLASRSCPSLTAIRPTAISPIAAADWFCCLPAPQT
jgi:hypothetical protein